MRYLALLCMLAAACAPSKSGGGGGDGDGGVGVGGDGGGGADAYSGPAGTVTGTVWAPGNAPSMVPAGHEIPIFGAVVYLSLSKPSPIPQTVYCDSCVQTPGGAVFTDHKGNFTLTNRRPDTYWLVIQKGQFRVSQQIVVAADQTLQLPESLTTLPSAHDPDNGRWIPRIALASGQYDFMEDLMGKLGLGSVDGSGKFRSGTASGVFDVYSNGGTIDGDAVGTLTSLVSDIAKMRQYHIIFIPCSGDANTSALSNTQNLQNIRTYVKEGGKLYVTDWSGEWSDNVFPEQVELRDDPFGSDQIDTPASAYDATNVSWNTSLFGISDDLDDYSPSDGEAVDADLNTWLNGQIGPLAGGGTGTYNASNFSVVDAWVHVTALHTVQIGTDDEGFPINDAPTAFVIGSDGSSGGKKPLTMTFEPVGCGRVLYSTYHTTQAAHAGLVPQERILVYLVMEIGVCHQGPIVE